MLTLQGMAGTGIPGTAGSKGEEGEQVGGLSAVTPLLKSPWRAQCLQSLPLDLPSSFSLVGTTRGFEGKGQRREDWGF